MERTFLDLGLRTAVQLACGREHVSPRVARRWLKDWLDPGTDRYWRGEPRDWLLRDCILYRSEKAQPITSYGLGHFKDLDLPDWAGTSVLLGGKKIWKAFVRARVVLSLASDRDLPDWLSLAPEVAEPWLSMIATYRSGMLDPTAPRAGNRRLCESGLRYWLQWDHTGMGSVSVWTRRRKLTAAGFDLGVSEGIPGWRNPHLLPVCAFRVKPGAAIRTDLGIQIPIVSNIGRQWGPPVFTCGFTPLRVF